MGKNSCNLLATTDIELPQENLCESVNGFRNERIYGMFC